MDRYIVSDLFFKHVMCEDRIYVELTLKLGATRFNRVRGKPLAELQKWNATGKLTRDERDYLELFLVWKNRLEHLLVMHFKSCFSL